MKFKTTFCLFFTAGLWLQSYGFTTAYDSYRGHQEYGYNAYEQNPRNDYDAYPGKRQERRTTQDSREGGAAVLGVLSIVGILWLMTRLRGGSSSRSSQNGRSSHDDHALRYSSPREQSSSYDSRPDPSAGHFWGNPEDGTTVKSLWGTTKEE
jgi:hypothetical protein